MLNVAVFGESEKGQFCIPQTFNNLEVLMKTLGHPPHESLGINLAIQVLLFKGKVIFFRVAEEGFSKQDYYRGFKYFNNRDINMIQGLAIPGVGDANLIEETKKICKIYKSITILTEKDLYDYLTYI